jgi:hypothetical protein
LIVTRPIIMPLRNQIMSNQACLPIALNVIP